MIILLMWQILNLLNNDLLNVFYTILPTIAITVYIIDLLRSKLYDEKTYALKIPFYVLLISFVIPGFLTILFWPNISAIGFFYLAFGGSYLSSIVIWVVVGIAQFRRKK